MSFDFNSFHSIKKLNVLDISYNDLRNVNFTLMARALRNLREFYAHNCYIQNGLEVLKLFGKYLDYLYLSGNFMGIVQQYFYVLST